MRRARVICGLLLLAGTGCASIASVDFGPYPASGLGTGSVFAGVAGFVPGNVPGEGEFLLTIANTDPTTLHTVIITPTGDVPITLTIAPCNVAKAAVSCSATRIVIEIDLPPPAVNPTLTITPNAAACLPRVVYIEVALTTGGTGGTGGTGTVDTTIPPSLTETLPASAAICFGGGLATTP